MSMSRHLRWVLLLGIIMATAGCGGGTPSSTDTPPPTVRVKIVPTFVFSQPTDRPQIATAGATQAVKPAATDEVFVLDPAAVDKGKARYDALECAACHASDTDPAASLVGYSDSEADFVTFMRSGGDLGTSHQYASNRLSETGAANLYQYLRSLGQ